MPTSLLKNGILFRLALLSLLLITRAAEISKTSAGESSISVYPTSDKQIREGKDLSRSSDSSGNVNSDNNSSQQASTTTNARNNAAFYGLPPNPFANYYNYNNDLSLLARADAINDAQSTAYPSNVIQAAPVLFDPLVVQPGLIPGVYSNLVVPPGAAGIFAAPLLSNPIGANLQRAQLENAAAIETLQELALLNQLRRANYAASLGAYSAPLALPAFAAASGAVPPGLLLPSVQQASFAPQQQQQQSTAFGGFTNSQPASGYYSSSQQGSGNRQQSSASSSSTTGKNRGFSRSDFSPQSYVSAADGDHSRTLTSSMWTQLTPSLTWNPSIGSYVPSKNLLGAQKIPLAAVATFVDGAKPTGGLNTAVSGQAYFVQLAANKDIYTVIAVNGLDTTAGFVYNIEMYSNADVTTPGCAGTGYLLNTATGATTTGVVANGLTALAGTVTINSWTPNSRITLYGSDTMIGKALVIRETTTNTRVACGVVNKAL